MPGPCTYMMVLRSIWPGNRSFKRVCEVHTFFSGKQTCICKYIWFYYRYLSTWPIFFWVRNWQHISNVSTLYFFTVSLLHLKMKRNPCQPSSLKTRNARPGSRLRFLLFGFGFFAIIFFAFFVRRFILIIFSSSLSLFSIFCSFFCSFFFCCRCFLFSSFLTLKSCIYIKRAWMVRKNF